MHVKASRTIINQGWLYLKLTGGLGNVHTILVLQACSYESQETMEAFSKVSKKATEDRQYGMESDSMQGSMSNAQKGDKEAKSQEREKPKCLDGRNMNCLRDQAWASQ